MSASTQVVDMLAMLRSVRKEKKFSYRMLGARIGVSKSLVCSWEHGQREPSPLRLIQWANALDFDLVLCPRNPQNHITKMQVVLEPQALPRYNHVIV